MIIPSVYKPIAKLWIGFSIFIGTVVSKILLTVIFYILVTPIGLIRKVLGFDSLQMKKWKKNDHSVFKDRDHTFESKDIENPY